MFSRIHTPSINQGTSYSFPLYPANRKPFDRCAFPAQISTWAQDAAKSKGGFRGLEQEGVFDWVCLFEDKICCNLQSKQAIRAIEQKHYVATRERNRSVCLAWELAPATTELEEGFLPSLRLYLVSITYGVWPLQNKRLRPRAKNLRNVNLRSFDG